MFFKTKKEPVKSIVPVCDNSRHLVCLPYSIDNLHIVAESLGIKRCWFHGSHYDIPLRHMGEIKSRCVIATTRQVLGIVQGVVKTV
jgi:hypothetical protein